MAWATNIRYEYGVASLSFACQINKDRSVHKVDINLPPIPNAPIEEFMRENSDLVREMKTALMRTQLLSSACSGSQR